MWNILNTLVQNFDVIVSNHPNLACKMCNFFIIKTVTVKGALHGGQCPLFFIFGDPCPLYWNPSCTFAHLKHYCALVSTDVYIAWLFDLMHIIFMVRNSAGWIWMIGHIKTANLVTNISYFNKNCMKYSFEGTKNGIIRLIS